LKFQFQETEEKMSDSFKVVTQESWFSRIGGAIKGVVVGFGLTAVSCGMLFWNEGRAVKRARALDEGQGLVVTVSADAVQGANEGKLILTNGEARATAPVQEPDFGFTADGIAIKREVSYYQWVEKTNSETQKKLGGGTETVTTYNYVKEWVSSPVSSSNFKEPDGHTNMANVDYKSGSFPAKEVKLGAFALSSNLVNGISGEESVSLTPEMLAQTPFDPNAEANFGKFQLDQGGFYFGMAPTAPNIGDVKVTFKKVPFQTVSVLGKQTSGTIGAYITSNGGELESVRAGVLGKEQFFAAEKSDNETMTWVLRGLGFFLCFVGIGMIFKPISVVADVIPFLGNIAEMGVGFLAFTCATVFSLTSVALGWFAYRPLLSVALLGGVAAAVFAIRQKKAKLAALAPAATGLAGAPQASEQKAA